MATSASLAAGGNFTSTVPPRRLGALEHPLILKNVDKAIKTTVGGPNYPLSAILDSTNPQLSIPLYLRYDNPTVRPLTSHNALSHNVVLKVTVPRRTGRKRKRGSNGPFEGGLDGPAASEDAGGRAGPVPAGHVASRDRRDAPGVMRRKLRDTVGRYTVQPVGVINSTHRYRGFADFQYAMGQSKFMQHFAGTVLTADPAKVKQFRMSKEVDTGPDIDLIPPPAFTPNTLPFHYAYSQNPYTRETAQNRRPAPVANSLAGFPRPQGRPRPAGGDGDGDGDGDGSPDEYEQIINVTSRRPAAGFFLAHDQFPVPAAPRHQPDLWDPHVVAIMREMLAAMAERPLWTRRSMWNRLGSRFKSLPPQASGGLVRSCLPYSGFSFKGGPWRDALVRYGVDPRSGPAYRRYQTLIFKLHMTRLGMIGRSWQAVRRTEAGVTNFGRHWQKVGKEHQEPHNGELQQDGDLSDDRGQGQNRDQDGEGLTEIEAPEGDTGNRNSHIFDGRSFSSDGKVWQVCDLTDPLLRRILDQAEVRTECDYEGSGWYNRVLWTVVRAIMKVKILAIRFGRVVHDDDFDAALGHIRLPQDEKGGDGDMGGDEKNDDYINDNDRNGRFGGGPEKYKNTDTNTDANANSRGEIITTRGGITRRLVLWLTLPGLQLTEAESELLRGKKMPPGMRPAAGGRWGRRPTPAHYKMRIVVGEDDRSDCAMLLRVLARRGPPLKTRRKMLADFGWVAHAAAGGPRGDDGGNDGNYSHNDGEGGAAGDENGGGRTGHGDNMDEAGEEEEDGVAGMIGRRRRRGGGEQSVDAIGEEINAEEDEGGEEEEDEDEEDGGEMRAILDGFDDDGEEAEGDEGDEDEDDEDQADMEEDEEGYGDEDMGLPSSHYRRPIATTTAAAAAAAATTTHHHPQRTRGGGVRRRRR